MLAHYGVDVLAPGCSLRRAQVLIERLPAGAWPDPHDPMSWSTETHMLATVVDAIALMDYDVVRMLGGKAKQPKPFARPKRKRTPPTGVPLSEGGAVKLSGWGEFAKTLAGLPGVVVEVDGG